MNYRTFGRTGLSVSEIGYGMWGMGGWTGSDDDAVAALAASGGRTGLQFLRYGPGLRRRAQRAAARTAAAPASPTRSSTLRPRFRPRTAAGPRGATPGWTTCFRPTTSAQTTETSLRNLGVDCLDLQQFHVWEDAWARDRALAAGRGRPEAPGTDPRRRHQRQPLGAVERAGDAADRADRRRAGDLQHLRPVARGRTVPAVPGN